VKWERKRESLSGNAGRAHAAWGPYFHRASESGKRPQEDIQGSVARKNCGRFITRQQKCYGVKGEMKVRRKLAKGSSTISNSEKGGPRKRPWKGKNNSRGKLSYFLGSGGRKECLIGYTAECCNPCNKNQ